MLEFDQAEDDGAFPLLYSFIFTPSCVWSYPSQSLPCRWKPRSLIRFWLCYFQTIMIYDISSELCSQVISSLPIVVEDLHAGVCSNGIFVDQFGHLIGKTLRASHVLATQLRLKTKTTVITLKSKRHKKYWKRTHVVPLHGKSLLKQLCMSNPLSYVL